MMDGSFILERKGDTDSPVYTGNAEDTDVDVGSEDDGFRDDVETENNYNSQIPNMDNLDDLGLFYNEQDSDAGGHVKITSPGHKRKRADLESISTPTLTRKRNPNKDKFERYEGFILEEDGSSLPAQSSRVLGTFGRQNRYQGECLAAYYKRISAVLDGDDQLILEMRDKGFSDRAIAEKLIKIGGIRYDPKSIGTRIMRIRLAQAANVDVLLAEGYKEWELEDDKLLMKAYAIADIETNYEIERARAWRFRKVSEYMRRFNKESIFSATACRQRYEAITMGAALIPTEQDDDPDLRRAQREAFCFAREEARNNEKAEKDAKDAMEAQAKEEAKATRAQKAEEIAQRTAAKHNETAQKLMKRAAQAQVRAQQAAANQNAKMQRNSQIQKQKAEAAAKLRQFEASCPGGDNTARSRRTMLPNIKEITNDTPDPRGYLSLQDLRSMCVERGFDTTDKTHDALVQQLRDADDEWSKDDLVKICRTKSLAVAGTKVQIKYRIALAAARNYPSFEASLAAANKDVGEGV